MPSGRIYAVVTVYDTPELLPHFLDHYTRLGVDAILVAANVDVPDAAVLGARYPMTFRRASYAGFSNQDKGDGEEAMLAGAGAKPHDWVLHLDLDEFHEYPAALRDMVRLMECHDIHAIGGTMFDRIAADATLKPVARTPSISDQYPLGGWLTSALVGGKTRKVMVARRDVRLASGRHDTVGGVAHDRYPIGTRRDYLVHHFRWVAGLLERLERRFDKDGSEGSQSSYAQRNLAFCERYRSARHIDLDDKRIQLRPAPAFRYPPGNPLLRRLAEVPADLWPQATRNTEILTALARFLRVKRVVELGGGSSALYWAATGRSVDIMVPAGGRLRRDVTELVAGVAQVRLRRDRNSGRPDELYDLSVVIVSNGSVGGWHDVNTAVRCASTYAPVIVVLSDGSIDLVTAHCGIPGNWVLRCMSPTLCVVSSADTSSKIAQWAR